MTSMGGEPAVRYEGGSPGTEIWGMTQANFLVAMPGRHAKEAAVNLTDAAAAWLAKELDQEDSAEFRQATARRVGEAFLASVLERGLPIESMVVASKAFFEEHPELVSRLRTVAPAA